ncbi:MAG: PAS domain S-box protein [Ignavibacteria bacterium]|nr:PAS domain S-box protein [Ignavibacteria bacterium]
MKRVSADQANLTIDIKLQKKDNQNISVESKISLVTYKGQSSILVVSRDITARKHAERILVESEAKYRTMIECLNEGIVITDLEDTILFANSPAADLLYKPIEKLVGYKAHEVIIPNGSYSKDFESRLQKRKQGISERYTEVIFNTDGNERVIEISAAPYKNAEGEVVGTVGAMYDITEQMKSQKEVIAAKEKFENLVLNAPVGIIRWLINERKYEFANREFERQSSMKLDEFTALTHSERLALIHPDDRVRATEVANEWIESGAYTPQVIQYRTFDKNGNIRWSNTYIYGERDSVSDELESITQISVDITELKAMQEALSIAQQEDFRRTVKNLQNLVVKMYRREDGEFVYSLREGKLANELTTTAVNGKTPKDLFGKDYETKTLPFLQRTFNGESVSFEAELPDGRYFFFTLEPLFENDLVQEIVGSAVEITNQKQIIKELHESENKFQTLTDVIPIGITQISHLLNGENIVDYVNPEFTRQSYYTLEKFIEKSKEKEWSFIHPDDKPMIIDALNQWHAGNRSEPFRSEYRFLRDDGKYIWLEVYLTNYEKSDGTIVGIQAGVDITQKKIVEQRLQHLASFPEQIPDPIIELSEDGTVTYLNPEAQNYFPTIAVSGFDHKVLSALPEKLQDIKSGEMSSYSIEIEYDSLYFEERVFYIAESNTFRVFLYDITDRKRNETELEKTLKKERELYSLKSRFLTTVSHEFRTPLTGIQISAEILSSHAAKMDFNQRINEITKIKDRVHDLTMLMNDFSMQSTIESIEDYYNPTTIHLSEISKILNTDVSNFIKSKFQTLVFNAAPTIPEIVGDERMLRQCLSNIILNASKYSANEKVIRVSIDVHESQWITIKIEDEGIGIPPDELHTLFTPFSRASNIGTRPGIGLGLSIAKDILEYHGGTLTVKSTLNVGSVFTILLPIPSTISRR